MNNFELFKLKKAGLTNLNILAILDYQEKHLYICQMFFYFFWNVFIFMQFPYGNIGFCINLGSDYMRLTPLKVKY